MRDADIIVLAILICGIIAFITFAAWRCGRQAGPCDHPWHRYVPLHDKDRCPKCGVRA